MTRSPIFSLTALALASSLALAGCDGGDPDSQSLDVHVNKTKAAAQDDGGDGGGMGVDASAYAAQASDQAVSTGQAAGRQAAGRDPDQNAGPGYRPGAIEQNDHPKILRAALRPDAYAPDAPPGLAQVQEGGDDQATPPQ